MKKRIIVLGDLHCGHVGGLTPPGWQTRSELSPELNALQSEMWTKYRALVRKYKEFDGKLIVVSNGDAIDGNRNLSELITGDRSQQVDMAQKCIQIWDADKYVFVEGTPYHTGKEEQWEKELAAKFGEDISPKKYLTVNGRIFYFRHKIGRSGIPYGRHTATAKEKMMNSLEAQRAVVPNASILCFSHVHYHNFAGGSGWLSMTLPALQTISNYGSRECTGQIDWGITYFDVDDKGNYTWGTDITLLNSVKQEAEVI